MSSHNTDPSPSEIEERLEDTRHRLAENLDELSDRMSPGNIVDEALRYFETGPKDFASTLGRQIQSNPMGALLTATGIAWMALGKDRPGTRSSEWKGDPDYYASGRRSNDGRMDDGWSEQSRSWESGDRASYDPATQTTSYEFGDWDDGDDYWERDEDDESSSDMYRRSMARVNRDMYERDDSFRRDWDTYRPEVDTWRSLERTRTTTVREENESDGDYYRRLDASYAEHLGIRREDDEDEASFSARIRGAMDQAKARARSARFSLKRSAQDARHRLGLMGERARYQARDARRKAADFHDENPLVSGAIAMAFGALAGSLFPVSQREHEAYEPMTDELLRRGADLAEQGAEQVERMADQVEGQAEQAREGTKMQAEVDIPPSHAKSA